MDLLLLEGNSAFTVNNLLVDGVHLLTDFILLTLIDTLFFELLIQLFREYGLLSSSTNRVTLKSFQVDLELLVQFREPGLESTDLLLDLLLLFMILHIIRLRDQLRRLFRNDGLLAHKHSNFVTAPFPKLVFVILRFEGTFAHVRHVLCLELLPLSFKLLLGFVLLLLL